MRETIFQRVTRTAEQLENGLSLQDRGVVDHEYHVAEDGTVSEIVAVLSVDDPYIEVECLSGVVTGSDGRDTDRHPVDSDTLTEYGRRLAEKMEERID
jgi:hypothetical protein